MLGTADAGGQRRKLLRKSPSALKRLRAKAKTWIPSDFIAQILYNDIVLLLRSKRNSMFLV